MVLLVENLPIPTRSWVQSSAPRKPNQVWWGQFKVIFGHTVVFRANLSYVSLPVLPIYEVMVWEELTSSNSETLDSLIFGFLASKSRTK